MNKHLHIVSFDVPYPPSYGGVIDVYFKIKALHEEGIKVHLHCFDYGRGPSAELNKICESVNYYQRKTSGILLLTKLPYIVSTRSSDELVNNLGKDEYPILFEGLHCCSHLSDPRLEGRIKIVRMHNIEQDYYAGLAKVERSFFKRWYFNNESKKLKRFENVLSRASHILAISPADAEKLGKKYKNVSNVMAFHPDEQVSIKEGTGTFALYHGNLSIGENNEAALFLVSEVFNEGDVPLVIAGNNPSEELVKAVAGNKHVELKSNIPTREIYQLIRDAQVNILPTFQATGIKLKLLAALYNGRYCIVNTPMVVGTGLEPLCLVKDTSSEMKMELQRVFKLPFDQQEKQKREKMLSGNFSNRANVKKITALL